MKPLLAFLLLSAVGFTSCDKDFGSPCPGCTLPDAGDPRTNISLSMHVSMPLGLYTPDQVSQIVDVADLVLLDATTRDIVTSKRIAIKGNGDVVDELSAVGNTALLYSSQVELDAPWGVYIISFHAHRNPDITTEKWIDCTSGAATVRFDY